METLFIIALLAVTAVGMEWVAYAVHRWIMHGFLWVLHEDHHRPTKHGLQKNDLFVLFFGGISFLFIFVGMAWKSIPVLSTIGFGMAIYGIGYFLFHDVMFHRRLRWLRIRPGGSYMQRIMNAHRLHHRHSRKDDAVSFGFLYASQRFAARADGRIQR